MNKSQKSKANLEKDLISGSNRDDAFKLKSSMTTRKVKAEEWRGMLTNAIKDQIRKDMKTKKN